MPWRIQKIACNSIQCDKLKQVISPVITLHFLVADDASLSSVVNKFSHATFGDRTACLRECAHISLQIVVAGSSPPPGTKLLRIPCLC